MPSQRRRQDGDTLNVTKLSTPSTPIGLFEDNTFVSAEYQVPPGAQLLIYSDGAFELKGDTDHPNPLSYDDFVNLCATLATQTDWSLDTLTERLKARSAEGQFDDDCALVLLTFQ